jgi:hypothetical protein
MTVANFTSRLPADAAEERQLVEVAFAAVSNLQKRAAEIRANPNLTEVGKREELKKVALNELSGPLKQAKARAAALGVGVENLRKGFRLKEPDKSDLFAEQQRSELRTFLRSQPEIERLRLALEDPAVAAAVAPATPALSGLSKQAHDLVVGAMIKREFGAQAAGVERRAEIVDNVSAAVEVARMQFRNTAGLGPEEI